MHARSTGRRVATTLAGLALLTACTDVGDPVVMSDPLPPAPVDQPIMDGPIPVEPDGGIGDGAGPPGGGPDPSQATIVEPTPGMENVRAVSWDELTVDNADQTEVTLYFWSGSEPCHVVDRVEVDLADDAVTLTIYEGSQPQGDGEMMACDAQAVYKGVRVTLDEPIGPRSILDGADA